MLVFKRMSPPINSRQSGHFSAFHCLGADCEDTCCRDWGISVDRISYEKYQGCTDPEMRPLLHQFVTISPSKGNDADFARFTLADNGCVFLAEGLCSIQLKMGESYLSNTCASFPRAVVMVDGVEERSLHLSCPEAARLVLLNQNPYDWGPDGEGSFADNGVTKLDSQHASREGAPYPFFEEVRELFVDALRPGKYARWQRLAIVGQLSEELNAILQCGDPARGQAGETAEFIARSRETLIAGSFDVRVPQARPQIQIETVLELIVSRIGSDFTVHRFLECYREFMQGLRWGPESSMEELDSRYAEARVRNYAPFMKQHEYLLDNFLINYCIRTVFPYGHREIGQRIGIDYIENSVRRQYLLLAVHYAVVRAVLIGMSAFHGAESGRAAFGTEHAIKLVQSYAKAFLHSSSYPVNALRILSNQGIHLASEAVALFQE
jgi:lysine-N-methylase